MKSTDWLLVVLVTFVNLACDSALPTKGNPNNCVQALKQGQDICAPLGLACDLQTRQCGRKPPSGCMTSLDCTDASAVVCAANQCVPCSSDQDCLTWANAQRSPNRLCISGTCHECRSGSDCQDPKRANCDLNPMNATFNQCVGCLQHADCPSQICKLDESLLDSPSANRGECVDPNQIVYVNNVPGCVTTGGGTMAAPYCQITDALNAPPASYKPYIRLGGSSQQYTAITVTGKRAIVLGPGRGSMPAATIAEVTVGNGGSVTLFGVTITGSTAVQCNTQGTVYLREAQVSPTSTGVNAVAACTKVWMERTKVASPSSGGLTGAGISIAKGGGTTKYRLVNNAVVGVSSSNRYGVWLGAGTSGYFGFNTIAGNANGVYCEGTQRITDSIVTANATQIGGTCDTQTRVVTDADVAVDRTYMTSPDPMLITIGASLTKNQACCINRTTQQQVDAETINALPQQGPVPVDYFNTPRPQNGKYDLGFQETNL